MSPGRHAAGDASFVRSAGGAATRGIILIVVAVLIGVVLIATAVDDNSDLVTASNTTAPVTTTAAPTDTTAGSTADTSATTEAPTATTVDTAPATTAATTTPTTGSTGAVFQPRPNSIVSVQVINTTRVGGAAGRTTDSLKSQGYVTLDPATESSGVLTTTKIHHIGGYLLEAQALAELLNLDPSADVFSMPANPGATIDNYLEPQVLVLLGSDLAS